MTVAIGDILEGKYEVVRHVGEGAWGDVYEGLNTRVNKRVAIKVLKHGHKDRRDIVERFDREARTATKIESPHVVQVYDAGVLAHDGRPYLVMEFLDGEDLGARIRSKGRLPMNEAAQICMQAARGLAHAHEAEILHRDMKPENIFLVRAKNGDEIAKIVDFGISKLVTPDLTPNSVTQTGAILGSPVYMSPEQARGARQSDPRSDVYSLGIVLYESLTGRTPFDAQSFNELMFKIALEDAPDVRTFVKDVDERLAGIAARCIHRDPDKRYQAAQDVVDALVDWLREHGEVVPDWRRSSGGGTRTTSVTNLPVTLPAPADLPEGFTASGNLRASLSEPRSVHTPTSLVVDAPNEAPQAAQDASGAAGHEGTVRSRRPAYAVGGVIAIAAAIAGVTAFGTPRPTRPSVAAAPPPPVSQETFAAPATQAAESPESKPGVVATPSAPTTIQTTPSLVDPKVVPSPPVGRSALGEGPSPKPALAPARPAPPPVHAAPKPTASPAAIADGTVAAPAPAQPKPATVGGRAIQTEL